MNLSSWADAFLPVFGMLALGAALKRGLLRDDAVWAGIERLVFWVLLPCLVAGALGNVRFGALPVSGTAMALWGALSLGALIAVLLARALGHDHAAMTSVLQGGIRFNNVMGFAIGGAIWGADGIAYAAVATGLIVPFVQAAATIAFEVRRGVRALRLLRQVILNSLILGCLAGFAIGALDGLPPGITPTVRNLGQAAIALGLLCVGAALTLGGLSIAPPTQTATALLKLIVMPLMTSALCALIGLGQPATAIAVLFMALPTAATSYVMARAMGGDAKLMAAITTSEHLLSALTLPVWVCALTR